MGEIEPTTTGGTGFPEPPPGYTFHNAHDRQEIIALHAQLAERESSIESAAIEKVNLLGQIESLQVALAERDREIERLRAHTCEVGAENPEASLGELKNLTPEEIQELRRLFQPRASYRELAANLSASQAREREAVEAATCACGDVFNENHRGICPSCMMVETASSESALENELTATKADLERARGIENAARVVIERFEPVIETFIFSKRIALTKLRAALGQKGTT